MKEQSQEIAKTATDYVSVGVGVGAVLELLPSVASIFTIVWFGIRIYETKTVQRMLGRMKR